MPKAEATETQRKAQEILLRKKKEWGLSWSQMTSVISDIRPGSIKAYASDARLIPAWAIESLFNLENLSPNLDFPEKKRSGSFMMVYHENEWHLFEIGDIRVCANCGRLFIPMHPQQLYCDTYRGECGREIRRKRYQKRK